MYQFDSRIRYSETGKDGRITLESILNYFQDCSTFHSEEVGYGMESLSKQNRSWILLSWQIVIEQYPKFGSHITIGTKAYDFKRSFGYRNFVMKDRKGQYIAYANSVWLYMDTKKQLPARADKAQIEAYQLEDRLPMEYAEMKIALPDCEPVICESFPVQYHHLDTNGHVNNGQYLAMAYQAAGEKIQAKQMRAYYKKSALLGDTVVPYVYKEVNKYVISINNEEKEPFAVIEFSM
ncbi:MAG: acyl-[acyl-carrier-protein] thioesterase [Lachnospiraceae bacterium]|nr:acyl-[acyl-carrier-protein] thioesterase [Lachnospiraceae bacterium]